MKRSWLDPVIGLALIAGSMVGFLDRLAPGLLDGDAGLFEYTPSVMGITYPTGYPMYLFLSRIWLALFPFGQIAWRMNLFSTVCASLALPIIYDVARRIWNNRLAALTTVLIFATLRTYWRWATEAKIYTLNILLFSIVLWLAVARDAADERDNRGGGGAAQKSWWRSVGRQVQVALYQGRSWLINHRYRLGAFVLGLQVGVHSTTVLLIPGIVLLFWLNADEPKIENATSTRVHHLLKSIPFFIIPVASYLYIPLRAEWLLGKYGRETAIAKGLVADFYHSGWSGWLRYFSAADFTGGIVTNWGKVPAEFFTVYLPILQEDFARLGVVLGIFGGLMLAWHRPRFFWPLLLIYVAPIPFVITYGQGEQAAFLLTSDLAFAIFAGGLIFMIGLWRMPSLSNLPALALFGVLCLILLYPQLRYNLISHRRDLAIYHYWTDVLSHPLEPEAGILATWGDLTSMWYMQHVEHDRPDLAGVYPPTEEIAADWLAHGRALYVAGPTLDQWPAGVMDRYQLVPWGRLVRLAPFGSDPRSLLPNLPQPQTAVFGQKLRLAGADFRPTVDSGDTLYVNLAWEALADLPQMSRYSLRLIDGDHIIAQKDDTLLSGWFPLDHLPAAQPMVGAYPVEVQVGTLPGYYRLQLAVYEPQDQPWTLPDGASVLDLGPVEVRFTPANGQPGLIRFNNEIALDQSSFSVKRVRQGKGFALDLLWRALQSPDDNYTLLLELVDSTGRVWRDWRQPVETASWRRQQQVLLRADLVVPAEAPSGDQSLSVRLSWLRPDDSRLDMQRWLIPAGQSLNLTGPTILEKEDRLWQQPPAQTKIEANFENQAVLVGYDLPVSLTLSQTEQAKLPVTLYWQGRGEMRQVYYIFVHLVNEAGQVVAQHDGIPAQGDQPTTSWAVGEYIIDPVEINLPPDLPKGIYSVVTGIYLPPQGPRLQLLDADGQAMGDSVILGQVRVVQ